MVLGQHFNTNIGDVIMSTDKKKMTKEEKINKAKKLMEQLNDCELSKDELRASSGAAAGPSVCMHPLYGPDSKWYKGVPWYGWNNTD